MTTAATVPLKIFEENQSNDNLVLNEIWQRESNTVLTLKNSTPVIESVLGLIREATFFVCISSGKRLPKEIIQEIPKLASRGIRVYLLLGEYDEMLGDFIADKAIVRLDAQVTGFQLLIDPQKGIETKRGYLFGYNCFEGKEMGIDFFASFNGEQLKEAFQFFIWRFWSAAEEQRGRKRLSQTGLRPPFDVYPLIQPVGYYYRGNGKDFLTNKIGELIRTASSRIYICISDFEPYRELYDVLFAKASAGVKVSIYTDLAWDHRFLKELEPHNGILIHSIKGINNFFVLADDRSGLLLSGSVNDQHETGIMLSMIDIQRFHARLKAFEGQMWTFHREIALRDLRTEDILFEAYDGHPSIGSIAETEVVDHGSFEAESIRGYFEGSYKPDFKIERRLARTIIHRWKLSPKQLDPKAKQDPLYDMWDKETAALKKHIHLVLEYARTIAGEKRTLFNSLLGVFNRENREDLDRIVKVLEESQKAIENGTFDWSSGSNLLENVDRYARNLQEQRVEMQEQAELQEKKDAWLKERKELEGEKERVEWTLEQLAKKKDGFLSEMNQLDPEIKMKLDEIRLKLNENDELLRLLHMEDEKLIAAIEVDRKTLQLCSFLNQEINKFNKLGSKDKKKHYSGKIGPYLASELEKVGKGDIYTELTAYNKISDAKEMMQYMMKQLGMHTELRIKPDERQLDVLAQYDELMKERKELERLNQETAKQIAGSKIEVTKQMDDIDKERRKLDNESIQVLRKLEKLGEEFLYIPNKKESQLPFQVPANIRLPAEKLPEVGELFRSGAVRQLAITDHKDLASAELEAERLNAELVLKTG